MLVFKRRRQKLHTYVNLRLTFRGIIRVFSCYDTDIAEMTVSDTLADIMASENGKGTDVSAFYGPAALHGACI